MVEMKLDEVLEREGGSIKTGPFGTVLKADEYRAQGVPVISVGEVGDGRIQVGPRTPRVGPEVLSRLPEYQLIQGDIVLGRKGAVDRSAWLRPEENGYFLGSDGIRIRFGGAVDSRFMAYQLRLKDVKAWLIQHAAGTTMASMNQRILGQLPLRVPPLGQQRAVTEVLGALDDKIAANDRLIATAGDLALWLTRAALTNERQPLASIANIVMGSSPPGSSYNEEGFGRVFYQGVRDFGVRFPSNRVWTTASVRMADAGDTLLSVRAPVGRTNLASEVTCIGRGLAAVTSTISAPMTLFHLLRADPSLWEPFEAEGTVFGSINRKQLEAMPIAIVDDGRASELEASLSAIESRLSAAVAESASLAQTRDALLPLLMSGKVTVKDAEKSVEEVV